MSSSQPIATAPSVLYDVRDGVALITWNRPERSNAWTPEMEARYFAHLREANASPEVRVIVVTGAGKNFCPGMDTDFLSASSNGTREFDPELREPQTVPTTIKKPIVAAIHGACAGTGLIQASMSDVRFVEADARVTAAFPRRGILAEHGLSVLLPELVGWAHATDILLSGRVLSGEEVSQMGFAKLSRPGQALADALAYAQDIADNCSPQALAVAKDQLWSTLREPMETARQEAIALWSTMRDHSDFKEGVASFVERRKPRFAPLGPDELRAVEELWAQSKEKIQ